MYYIQFEDQFQPILIGLWMVFEYFQYGATSNRTNSKTKQPQLRVQLHLVVFSLVLVFCLVYATKPANTRFKWWWTTGGQHRHTKSLCNDDWIMYACCMRNVSQYCICNSLTYTIYTPPWQKTLDRNSTIFSILKRHANYVLTYGGSNINWTDGLNFYCNSDWASQDNQKNSVVMLSPLQGSCCLELKETDYSSQCFKVQSGIIPPLAVFITA